MLAHLEAYVGPCWPILNHKIRKMGKKGKSTKHRKTREFLAVPTCRRQGARPLSPTERRETPSAMPRPGGPWPDLSAYARQPARGPCWGDMCCPILRLCCPILRLCWSILALCWPVLGPRLADLEAYVDPCWAKRSEKGEQQKNTVKRMIFWWSAAYLGAMLAHLGAMLAYLEAMWAHLGAMLAHFGAMLAYLEGNVGPSWRYVGPARGYLGPSGSYVGPSWGYVCWPILRPIFAHVDPSWATSSEKWEKKGRAQNTVKRGSFWRGEWSAAGAAAPLSYGEERNAVRLCHLAGFKGCRLLPPTPGISWTRRALNKGRSGTQQTVSSLLNKENPEQWLFFSFHV